MKKPRSVSGANVNRKILTSAKKKKKIVKIVRFNKNRSFSSLLLIYLCRRVSFLHV